MDNIDFGAPVLLDLLDVSARNRLEELATRRRYVDGELVHERGDTGSQMCLVVEGAVRLIRRREDGQTLAISTLAAGRHFGDNASVIGHARTHDAVAVGQTIVDHFNKTAFDTIINKEPAILQALYRIVAHRLKLAIDMFDDIRRLPPLVRVAKLVNQSLPNAHDPNRLECLQEDIAQILGLSGVSVGRSLKQLEKEGLLSTGYRCIEVPAPQRLADWVTVQDP